MDEKTKPDSLVTLTIGALIGIALTVFAIMLRRTRLPSSLPATDFLPDPSNRRAIETSPMSRRASSIPSNPPGTSPASTGPRWTAPTKYIMGVILFLVALLVLVIGRGVIPMVILAALLALFINPVIGKMNRRFHLSWSTATAFTYVLVILVLFLGLLILIPNLLDALNYLMSQDYQLLARQSAEAIRSFSGSLQVNPTITALLSPLLETIAQAFENFSVQTVTPPVDVEVNLYSLGAELGDRLGVLVDILGPVVGVVVGGILILFMSLQMSLAANQISDWYPDLIPPDYKEEYADLFERITKTWISFLRGQLTLMMIIGLVTWLGGTILGVPYALLMGLLAGLLELIPNVGPILAAIPAVVLALLFGSTYLPLENLPFALLVVGFYVLVQLLENQFIVPYVMGDAVDLPPVIVLIGAIAGAYAFGILGALLATPVIATGNLVFRFIYRKILEPPPISIPVEEKPSIWDRIRGWVKRIAIPAQKPQAEKVILPEKATKKVVIQPTPSTEVTLDVSTKNS